MGLTIQQEEENLRVLRISGLLRKSELDGALTAEASRWGPATHVRVLVIVEDFKGWEPGVDWGDMTFFETQGDGIDKITIVADPKWEAETLAFAGQGFVMHPSDFSPKANSELPGPGWVDRN